MSFLEALQQRVIVGDGALGSWMLARGAEGCLEALNLTRPLFVRGIHREYVAAGADLIETNTSCANRVRLKAHGLDAKVAEINRRAVELAREAAGPDIFVAGAIGPITPGTAVRAPELADLFEEQAAALAGADLLMLETFVSIQELLAAISAARRVTRLPIVAQMSFGENGLGATGDAPAAFARTMRAAGADVIGANCGLDPEWTVRAVEAMAPEASLPLSAFPAGGPGFATAAQRLIAAGVRLIGGCCGTGPAEIRALSS